MKTDAKTTDKWLKKADKKAVKVVLLSTVFFIVKKLDNALQPYYNEIELWGKV